MLSTQNSIKLIGLLTMLTLLPACGGGSSSSLLSGTNTNTTTDTNPTAPTWRLVWSDEFDGASLDTASWTHELGDGSAQGIPGWGNNEEQFYREENTSIANGNLIIEARQETFGGKRYTSSRIKTQAKRFFRFGKIEARAKLPRGQGMWPAIWMLGEIISTTSWPASGEIDIMEMVGGSGREDTVHGTIHWDNNGHRFSGGSTSLSGETFSDDFHVFSIEWDADRIIWLVDDEEFHSETISASHQSELRNDFYILVNLAVGGNWPGPPDGTSSFPQQLLVDYVRVYEAG